MSLLFYAQWNAWNLWVILGSIAFNWWISGRISGNAEDDRARKLWLVAGVAANLAVLSYFKYLDFFFSVLSGTAGFSYVPSSGGLPLGISFFTFQQIIYLVDLYRKATVSSGVIDYVFCVTFFPHLIAGPIIRYRKLLPQLQDVANLVIRKDFFAAGLVFFTLGLLKKVVIADNLAPIADAVFSGTLSHLPVSTPDAWGGALAYTLQLYFDFSGYSDMAIGLGLFFGVELPVNFNSPYKSRSIVEFWRRWHITLSEFLRDYLYIVLGGNRKGSARQYLNLMVTMFLGGLWHGAGWTFVLWGGMHGAGLCATHLYRKIKGLSDHRGAVPRGGLLAWAGTMLFIIFAWVLFRADNMPSAWRIWMAMLGFGDGFAFSAPAAKLIWIVPALLVALFAPNCQQIMGSFRGAYELYGLPRFSRLQFQADWVWGGLTAIAFLGVSLLLSTNSKFLYFDF